MNKYEQETAMEDTKVGKRKNLNCFVINILAINFKVWIINCGNFPLHYQQPFYVPRIKRCLLQQLSQLRTGPPSTQPNNQPNANQRSNSIYLAIPAFDRIAVLYNRHLISNWVMYLC